MQETDLLLTLDLMSREIPPEVQVQRGDTARNLEIHLFEGKDPYFVDPSCLAVLTAKKPDRTALYNVCDIRDGVVFYDFTEQTTSCPGLVPMEIRIYGGNKKLLTAATFYMEVYDTVYQAEDAAKSQDEQTALNDLVNRTTDLLNRADDGAKRAEAAAAAAEQSKAAAKGSENEAKLRADESEKASTESKAYSEQAGREKTKAEESAKKAEKLAELAENNKKAAESAREGAAAAAQEAAAGAEHSESQAKAAETCKNEAIKSEQAALGAAKSAAEAVELAKQAAATSGYMKFEIVNGRLIYTKTANVETNFKLEKGRLIAYV